MPNASEQGVYVIIDPYQTGSLGEAAYLANAAALGCADTTGATPFCQANSTAQAASGIYLQIKWCSFELYAGATPVVTVNGQTTTDPNYCNYLVTSCGDKFLTAETESPCDPVKNKYDLCVSGLNGSTATGILYGALADIVTMDTARANIGLPHLHLEIGLQSGAAAALNALNDASIGNVAMPVAASGNILPAGSSGTLCVALPNVWAKSYITRYEHAIDHLLSAIIAYDGGFLAQDITIVKATPVNSISEEYNMAGENGSLQGPADPNTAGNIACSGTPEGGTLISGAQTWYDEFYPATGTHGLIDPSCATSFPSPTMIQAVECTFGDVTGNILGTLDANNLSDAVVSVPNNNGQALPYIDCGLDEAGSTAPGGGGGICQVEAANDKDQFTSYYYYLGVYDLFQAGTPAYVAASAAIAAADPGAAYPPPETRVATDFTGLNATNPSVSTNRSSLTCGLNDSLTADPTGAHSLQQIIYGNLVAVPQLSGAGILPSWQTNTGLFSGSTPPPEPCPTLSQGGTPFIDTVNNGVDNGGQFFEVQVQIGFDKQCLRALATAVTDLQSATPPGRCQYAQ